MPLLKQTPQLNPPQAGVSGQILIIWLEPQGFAWSFENAGPDQAPSAEQAGLQQDLIRDDPPPEQFLLRLGFSDPAVDLSPSLDYLRRIVRAFLLQASHLPDLEFNRSQIYVELPADQRSDILNDAPFMPGGRQPDQDWLQAVLAMSNEAFRRELKDWPGSAEDWFTAHRSGWHTAGKVIFNLVENPEPQYPFAFLATYAVRRKNNGLLLQIPLRRALDQTAGDMKRQLAMLTAVHRAAEKNGLIRSWLQSGELMHPLRLSAREAWQFLRGIPDCEAAGVVCRVPDWWRQRTAAARINVTLGDQEPARLGLDALLDFRLDLMLGDASVSLSEIEQLSAESAGLLRIKGHWTEVDPEQLKDLLKAYEQVQKTLGHNKITLLQALRLQMKNDRLHLEHGNNVHSGTDKSTEVLEINQGSWLRGWAARLVQAPAGQTAAGTGSRPESGDDFRACLRPYQERGLFWLQEMKRMRLGACLADDMGLGKTIQVIALMNAMRRTGQIRMLLVVPASLIGNWQAEIRRFAPALRFLILHSSETPVPETAPDDRSFRYDLLITTYGLVLRTEWLRTVDWDLLVLDEAQAIKNPAARQTRAVKQLKAGFRIALTGTPIENQLADLWSIFDFLNKGLLGTPAEFTAFARKLPKQPDGYAPLRQVVNLFLLRRVKTDPAVIRDLPAKIEVIAYSRLSRRQAGLYKKTVNDLENNLRQVNGLMERRGLVLAALVHLKQLCNHPDLYLGQAGYQESDSGKFARLREICDTIREKHEKVLVFTQFQEMVEPLRCFLDSIFGHPGLVLHGGTPVAARQMIVARFQSDAGIPFLVLSLKAGGLGLNLTAANHVIHFDRWWNPAVENQATDRVFRIGQTRQVLVHLFVSEGTIEEKIDKMIEDKKQLVQDLITDRQDKWITEMEPEQLFQLLRLS